MLLTLDVGNTNIKSALFADQSLKELIVHHDEDKVSDYLNETNFNEAAICSVNPRVEKLISEKISSKGIKVFRVSIRNKFTFDIAYETPETLGIDRLCSAAGAFDIALKNNLLSKGQYLLTIDFGTATTINIVSPDKKFLGGLIAPGISTMLRSLNEKTAQLPIPELNSYKGVIGASTNSSILSGVVTATIGMIKETTAYLESKSEVYPLIFATGGNAGYILPYLDDRIIFDEALVLKGLKTIYDLNKPGDKL
jgi:type III pantothenate kinase